MEPFSGNAPLAQSSSGITSSPAQQFTDIENKERERAAIVIQSVWRMFHTSSRVVLPGELRPFLTHNLEETKTPEELEALTWMISRESLTMLKFPAVYKKGGIRRSKSKEKYVDGNGVKHNFPRTLWLHLKDHSQIFHIQIYGRKLKHGTYKDVKESKTIEVRLGCVGEKPMKCTDTVLIRTRIGIDEEERKKFTKKQIEDVAEETIVGIIQSFQTIMTLFSVEEIENDPDLKLAGIPKIIRRHQGKTRNKLEWEDERFPSDLTEAHATNSIKLDIAGKTTVPFPINDKCRILEDLFDLLVNRFHRKGKVHGDVSSKNILLKYNPEKQRPEGYLMDFDIISDFEVEPPEDILCSYWDRCSEKGFTFPTRDIFGLGTCLVGSVFGQGFSVILGKVREENDFDQIKKIIESHHGRYTINRTVQLYRSFERSEQQKSTLRNYIQRISYEWNLMDKIVLHKEVVDALVEEMIHTLPLREKLIKEFQADIFALYQISLLMLEMYRADLEMLGFVINDPRSDQICECLVDKNTSAEQKWEALQAMYTMFPVFSEFGARVKKIREDWEKLALG